MRWHKWTCPTQGLTHGRFPRLYYYPVFIIHNTSKINYFLLIWYLSSHFAHLFIYSSCKIFKYTQSCQFFPLQFWGFMSCFKTCFPNPYTHIMKLFFSIFFKYFLDRVCVCICFGVCYKIVIWLYFFHIESQLSQYH